MFDGLTWEREGERGREWERQLWWTTIMFFTLLLSHRIGFVAFDKTWRHRHSHVQMMIAAIWHNCWHRPHLSSSTNDWWFVCVCVCHVLYHHLIRTRLRGTNRVPLFYIFLPYLWSDCDYSFRKDLSRVLLFGTMFNHSRCVTIFSVIVNIAERQRLSFNVVFLYFATKLGLTSGSFVSFFLSSVDGQLAHQKLAHSFITWCDKMLSYLFQSFTHLSHSLHTFIVFKNLYITIPFFFS